MTKKEYRQTRRPFTPTVGTIYNNEGGGRFECVSIYSAQHNALMRNIASGWTFTANGIGIYCDGKIDWDYSTGGRFEEARA